MYQQRLPEIKIYKYIYIYICKKIIISASTSFSVFYYQITVNIHSYIVYDKLPLLHISIYLECSIVNTISNDLHI